MIDFSTLTQDQWLGHKIQYANGSFGTREELIEGLLAFTSFDRPSRLMTLKSDDTLAAWWDQGTWGRITATVTEQAYTVADCGTACCLAGNVMLQTTPRADQLVARGCGVESVEACLDRLTTGEYGDSSIDVNLQLDYVRATPEVREVIDPDRIYRDGPGGMEYVTTSQFAQGQLGLTDDQASVLFGGSNMAPQVDGMLRALLADHTDTLSKPCDCEPGCGGYVSRF